MMMTGSVLDILIYVFDRYMLDEVPEVPEREHLARDLEACRLRASERGARARLAGRSRVRARSSAAWQTGSGRDGGAHVLATASWRGCRRNVAAFSFTLERLGILSPQQREIVIERMLALDADELDTEQLKWVVLMVLSSQPGQEQAFERLEDLVADAHPNVPH